MTRTTNSLKNIKYNYIFEVASILGSFISRRVFTRMLTQEYLGLNGTFASILSMLSLAELGIGNAIIYSLYKPLGEGDRETSAALMQLYKKAYTIIGLAIAVAGFAVAPFLDVIIKDMPDIPHIRLIYLIFVFDTSLSYFFVYKQSLISADQRQRIVSGYRQCGKILLYVFQIIGLLLTHNYFVYLGLKVTSTIVINVLLSRKADRLYPWLKTVKPKPVDKITKSEIIRNSGAMLSHKIGSVVVYGTDNLLMSAFSGVKAVGLYSNYTLVADGLSSVYSILFSSVTASVGNLGATENDSKYKQNIFFRLNFLSGWIYGFSSVCLVVLFNPFIKLWLDETYLLPQKLSLIIAVNFYLNGMRKVTLTFRDAFGVFWYDRYKPLAESVINLAASILLAKKMGIAGIILGTTISTLATSFWTEPYVLFKYGFCCSILPFFKAYFKNTVVTVISGFIMWNICLLIPDNGIALFAVKTFVCVVGSNIFFLLAYCRSEELKFFVQFLRNLLVKKTKKQA